MIKFVDRISETSSNPGTGDISLSGPVSGFQAFSVIGNNNTCYYNVTDGTAWEVGIGTYVSSGNKLQRTRVFASSNSNALVNFTGAITINSDIAAYQFQNDFGDGSDGAVTIAADTNWENNTVADDTGYVLKQFTSLTINSGKVVTANHRSQIMVIKVTGNCTIAGTLKMDAKGAAATPSVDFTLSRWLLNIIGDRVIAKFAIPILGGAGGAGSSVHGGVGANGSNGLSYQTGGGGGGGGGVGGGSDVGLGGNGAAGSAYCGGSGGGGGGYNGSTGVNGGNGAINGGAGGDGATVVGVNRATGAGSGNPVGTGQTVGNGAVVAPTGGGGGTLILIIGGNLTISGTVSSNGSAGGNASATGTSSACGGGGSGGGSILLLYAGTLTISGTTQANGGAAGTASAGTYASAGGAGGNGTISSLQIEA